MSELPAERDRAHGPAAKERAWSEIRDAQSRWADAMRAHKLAPPDPGFRGRLRASAEAAVAIRDAHERALKAGLAWRAMPDAERARPPYELRAGTGRRGPADLWARFDGAVERLNAATAGDSLAAVMAGYAAVAQAARALADALEAAGE